MSWISKLYQTYETGVTLKLSGKLPDEAEFMPVSHTLQNAHINIVIDEQGNFKRAKVLEKTQIVLPATESSAGRSSGEAPHPLADKLHYVAKDYAQYGGLKKPYFASYEKQLADWCNSPFSHSKAQAVYRYINKGQVIADLINAKILFVDAKNQLLTKWPFEVTQENPIPLIFKVLPKEKGETDQGTALVCWSVETFGNPETDTWTDKDLQQKWIDFSAAQEAKAGLCYVIGKQAPLAINHPAKLRHTGDKAKLISSNDKQGFTYRGKFIEAEQACGVSFEVTQKAHNALRWLIKRQSYRNGEQVIIAWAISGKEVPNPFTSAYDLFNDDLDDIELNTLSKETEEINTKIDNTRDLGKTFALKLKKRIKGYREQLGDSENIIVMAMDSATPGRMGITFYQEYLSKIFIDRIESWQTDFAWLQRYAKKNQTEQKKQKTITSWLISAPAPTAIAEAAYGKTLTDTLRKNLFERLLPCIVEAAPIPIDIVTACVNRAVNPHSLEYWQWERNLGIACALYRGFYLRHPIKSKRRKYAMSLEKDNTSRDYLYGRLLAIAERIEKKALAIANEKRPTTAERLMAQFADKPFSTWRNIELALKPYMQRLQNNKAGFLANRKKELDAIMNAFKSEDFKKNDKLSGEFLLGFHCQRHSAYSNNEVKNLEVI